MARNRINYANQILMVSPSSTGCLFLNQQNSLRDDDRFGDAGESMLRQLKRVQSLNYGWNISRTDVNQFGNLARIDSVVLDSPVVSLDFTYLLTDGKNEHLLGLNTEDGSNILSTDFLKDQDGRNFYILTSPEGTDATPTNDGASTNIAKVEAQDDSKKSVIAVGNGFVTNYSVTAAVGAIPNVNVSVEAFNVRSTPGTSGESPGIDITDGTPMNQFSYKIPSEYITSGSGLAALRPGDVNVSIGGSGLLSVLSDAHGKNASHIQSVSIDVPLSRTTLQRVGNQFGFSKTVNTPISTTISVSALLADQLANESADAIPIKSLFEELYKNNKNDLTVTFRKPNASGPQAGDTAVIYTVTNAELSSESYGMSIGDNRVVDYTFTATIGDPGVAAVGSSYSTVQMSSSGVYEQLQVFTTGKVSDDPMEEYVAGGARSTWGTAVGVNDNYLVIGGSGLSPLGDKGGVTEKEVGAAYIYRNNKGFYTQILQTSGGKGDQHGDLYQLSGVGGVSIEDVTNHGLIPSDQYGSVDVRDYNFGCAASVSQNDLIAIGASNSNENGFVEILEPAVGNADVIRVNSIISGAGPAGGDLHGDAVAFDKKGTTGDLQFMVIGSRNTVVGASGGATADFDDGIGQIFVASGKKGELNSFANPIALIGAGNSTNRASTAAESQSSNNGNLHTTGQLLGDCVSMYDKVIVAGAPRFSGHGHKFETQSGAAFVFHRTQGNGTVASDWSITNVLSGQEFGSTTDKQNAAFGEDVAVFDKTIAVGAPSGTYNGNANAGAVFVFTGANGDEADDARGGHYGFNYVATLTPNDADANKRFGSSVSMPDSHTIVVGAEGGGGVYEGSVYIFTGYEGNWTQTQQIGFTGTSNSDRFGFPETSLATNKKEFFVGGHTSERVVRYRI